MVENFYYAKKYVYKKLLTEIYTNRRDFKSMV